jgi:hypothetical protein
MKQYETVTTWAKGRPTLSSKVKDKDEYTYQMYGHQFPIGVWSFGNSSMKVTPCPRNWFMVQ